LGLWWGGFLDEHNAIDIVDHIVTAAIALHASDVHADALEDGMHIRLRVDGLLVPERVIASDIALQVVARIKVLAGLDVAQVRLPQDGKFIFKVADAPDSSSMVLDIRVATFPSLYGEKVVLRLLYRDAGVRSLDALGLETDMIKQFKKLLDRCSGLVLVTGPTGAGKTTTLYSSLLYVQQASKNIMTLEDPVEYTIAGITQMQVHHEIDLSFARGLRSMVRLDPDIIMVGEIRDRDTASVAIQAALTGHLVLSTLHTIDAPGAVMRLMDMGIEPFLINAAVTGVVAQRLVRSLCSACKKPVDEQAGMLFDGYTGQQWEAAGCKHCHGTGCQGRMPVAQLLTMTPTLHELIRPGGSYGALAKQAIVEGMQPLVNSALSRVQAGQISITELLRVFG
jgi:type II secretory ATPase GspE/PulE/Tfp pilus assembly ATPase PilB-like protein